MVRIFAAGDFHGDKTIAKQLADRAVAEHADMIILNGDIVEEDETAGVMYHFVKTGKPVFLVPGNHDWFATDFLCAQYDATNLHAKSIVHGSVGIMGCGGTNAGSSALTEGEISEIILSTDRTLSVAKKVLVTHIHPAGTKMESFSQYVQGSSGLRSAIEQIKPDVVICGHVHEAEGIEEKIGKTVVINVGKAGKLIVI